MQFLLKNPKYSDFAVCSIRRILVRAVTFLLLPKKVLFRHLVCLRLVTSGYGICLGRSHGQPPVLPEGWLRPRRVGHLTQARRDHAHGHHQGQGTQQVKPKDHYGQDSTNRDYVHALFSWACSISHFSNSPFTLLWILASTLFALSLIPPSFS